MCVWKQVHGWVGREVRGWVWEGRKCKGNMWAVESGAMHGYVFETGSSKPLVRGTRNDLVCADGENISILGMGSSSSSSSSPNSEW